MKNQEIPQNNISISYFIGIYIKKKWLGYGIYNKKNAEIGWTFTEKQAEKELSKIPFNSEYNCLMPVVIEIEQLNCTVGIFTGLEKTHHCMIAHFDRLGSSDKEISCENAVKLTAVYLAIIKFISWYNKNK